MRIILIFIWLLLTVNAKSLIQITCDAPQQKIYLDGNFKKKCKKGQMITLEVKSGNHILLAKSSYQGAYYNFKTKFQVGDGVIKSININSKIKYTEKYYYYQVLNSKLESEAETYLKKYPNGKYVQQVKLLLEKWFYEDIVANQSIFSIKSAETYLKKYPNGKYVQQVKNILEKLYYQKFVKVKDIGYGKTYLKKYPNGKYVQQVKNILEKLYYKKASKSIVDKKIYTYKYHQIDTYRDAKIYLKKYPNGRYTKQIKNLLHNNWQVYFNGKGEAIGNSVVTSKDGCAVVLGVTSINNKNNIYIVKVDKNGRKIWEKIYRKNQETVGYDIISSPNGEYLIIGYTVVFNNVGGWLSGGKESIYILKIDENGNKLWEKVYKTNEKDLRGTSIDMTKDRNYIISGYIKGSWVDEPYILKIDKNGNKIWDKIYQKHHNNKLNDIITTKDGYIAIGYSVTNDDKVYVLKIDKNGNKIWDKVFGGEYIDEALSIIKAQDGYIIVGCTSSFGKRGKHTYILKINGNGQKIWQKVYEISKYDDVATTITKVQNGGYIIGGYFSDYMYIMYIDEDGNQKWIKKFLDTEHTHIINRIVDSNNGYIVTGYAEPFGRNFKYMFLWKFSDQLIKYWGKKEQK